MSRWIGNFRNANNSAPKTAKNNKTKTKSDHKQQMSLSSIENRQIQLDALKNSERKLYSYDKPQQELGMTELLKQHEPGSRFMYAAVTGREDEDYESRLSKLRGWKPNFKRNTQAIDNIPNLKLYREVEVFPIKPLVDTLNLKRGRNELGDFFRVVEAMVIYGAIVSPDCNFTQVKVAIVDNRLMDATEAKSFTADTNKEARGDLRMPYCIPVENADLLSLVISRDNQFLVDGMMWGVIKIRLSLEFCDFPKQYDNQDVMALNMITASALGERITNPDAINVSITNNDRKALTDLYQSEDLVDTDVPEKNKTSLRTAKSSIRDAPKGDKKHFGEGWGDMAIPRKKVEEASIEPEDDFPDSASDLARKAELVRTAKANQEALRSHFDLKTQEGRVEEVEEEPATEVSKPKRATFSDNLNLFD
jgi:hypothetical protein